MPRPSFPDLIHKHITKRKINTNKAAVDILPIQKCIKNLRLNSEPFVQGAIQNFKLLFDATKEHQLQPTCFEKPIPPDPLRRCLCWRNTTQCVSMIDTWLLQQRTLQRWTLIPLAHTHVCKQSDTIRADHEMWVRTMNLLACDVCY